MTVQADGTYTIEPYESPGSGPKALKILKSTDAATGARTWYYIESRQPIGFDAYLADPSVGAQQVMSGLVIHTGSESSGNSAFLLDMTPATPVYYWWYDFALAPGQSFVDPDTGLTITTSWVSSSGAGVTVKVAAGTPVAAPTVAVSTNQPSYTRGQTASITAKVTSAGVAVAKATVGFTIVKSTGAKVSATVTTGSNGLAVYKLRLGKQDPVGTYRADATATASGKSAVATTTFIVQ
jgi:hypothetical protein